MAASLEQDPVWRHDSAMLLQRLILGELHTQVPQVLGWIG